MKSSSNAALTHVLFGLQAVVAAQGGGGAGDGGGVIGESALDSHSSTFTQPKDVDPASTSENSQCRCPSPPLSLCSACACAAVGAALCSTAPS